jgi:hypothetical protein
VEYRQLGVHSVAKYVANVNITIMKYFLIVALEFLLAFIVVVLIVRHNNHTA